MKVRLKTVKDLIDEGRTFTVNGDLVCERTGNMVPVKVLHKLGTMVKVEEIPAVYREVEGSYTFSASVVDDVVRS